MQQESKKAMEIDDIEDRRAALEEIENCYDKKDWMTQLLSKEVSDLFPKEIDIDRNNNNSRDRTKFKTNMESVCFPKRIFASHKQLHQYLLLFSSQWGFKITITGKGFFCHYQERKRSSRANQDPSKRRKRDPPASCDCPFVIRYSLPVAQKNKSDPNWKPTIFQKVRIRFLLFLLLFLTTKLTFVFLCIIVVTSPVFSY